MMRFLSVKRTVQHLADMYRLGEFHGHFYCFFIHVQFCFFVEFVCEEVCVMLVGVAYYNR